MTQFKVVYQGMVDKKENPENASRSGIDKQTLSRVLAPCLTPIIIYC